MGFHRPPIAPRSKVHSKDKRALRWQRDLEAAIVENIHRKMPHKAADSEIQSLELSSCPSIPLYNKKRPT
jgi:hypothetical protein